MFMEDRRTALRPLHERPTYKKVYGRNKSLSSRIFVPKAYKSGDPPIPLLIDIHGGGFCIGGPILDDKDNLIWAHKHGFLVISIPYRLGPRYKFPTAEEDCAAAIRDILDDESLPVDKSRVAIVGYSAGGNLALGAAQMPDIKGRIKGVAAYYPPTNLATPIEEKFALMGNVPGGSGALGRIAPAFDYGFTGISQDRADPLLSPSYAKREDLPDKISIVTCEYDMLANESTVLAEELADLETGDKAPLPGDRHGWTKGRIRWELIEAAKHGFNQTPASGKAAEELKQKTDKTHAGIAEWLRCEVYNP